MTIKYLPPDGALEALVGAVNAKLGGAARIHAYRIPVENGAIETGLVYESGSRRGNVRIRHTLSEHDAGEIAKAVIAWTERQRGGNRWTLDPTETAFPT